MKNRYYHDIDLEDVEQSSDPEEPETFFGHLYATEDECYECGYFGPLRSTRKGYRCPECRALVVPVHMQTSDDY